MNTESLTLTPGDVVVLPGTPALPITRIEQTQYDQFWITVGDDPVNAFIVDTHGFNRIPEQPIPADAVPDEEGRMPRPPLTSHVEALPVHLYDLIRLPGLELRRIGHVLSNSEKDRHELRLDQKYQPSIIIDIDQRRRVG